MVLGAFRPPLTAAEKQHRASHGLCLYCGDKNHQVGECPKCPKSNTARGISAPAPYSSYPTLVACRTSDDSDAPIIHAMADGGAFRCIIHIDTAHRLGIKLDTSQPPLGAIFINGKPINILGITHPFPVNVCPASGTGPRVQVRALLTGAVLPWALVLGHDWLVDADPTLHPRTGSITFGDHPAGHPRRGHQDDLDHVQQGGWGPGKAGEERVGILRKYISTCPLNPNWMSRQFRSN
jgi:hypothetical protein